MKKNIIVVPYNNEWPKNFEIEAHKLRQALGNNCIAVHHVGSTAIPGLSAKPVIDIICVVKNGATCIQPIESLGFKYKGEYNIPMRLYFNRNEGVDVNLHVYEENNPEIELNLLFRDYLRAHPEEIKEYESLKKTLLLDESSYEKKNSPFTGYNLGKDAFIRKILKLANFNRFRMTKCTHYVEWDALKKFTGKTNFDENDHTYLIFYYGVDIVGFADVDLQGSQARFNAFSVIEENFADQFRSLCLEWFNRIYADRIH